MSRNLIIEDAKIIFKNFAGAEDRFNRAGNRNFAVIIDDPEMVDKLIADGWNIKVLKPRDEYDQPTHYLPVTVNLDNRNVKLHLVTRKNVTLLNEETAELLDYTDLDNVDLAISPYDWEVNGKTGRKAYLQTLYANVREDELAYKYERNNDINDSYHGRYSSWR